MRQFVRTVYLVVSVFSTGFLLLLLKYTTVNMAPPMQRKTVMAAITPPAMAPTEKGSEKWKKRNY